MILTGRRPLATETEQPMAQVPQARITALQAELQRVPAEADAQRERDRVVKERTAQVRSLEDQSEDGYHQMDAVRRQHGQRDDELAAVLGEPAAGQGRLGAAGWQPHVG
jgi:hypothetical protein